MQLESIARSLFLTVALVAASRAVSAGPSGADPCDALFADRNETSASALAASSCYLGVDPSAESLYRAARASSLAYLKGVNSFEKEAGLANGFATIGKMSVTDPDSAPYWNAAFTTFRANLADEGSVLPRNILAAIPAIQSDLRKARDLAPSTHFYGPDRVLGILFLSMPGIVGGDVKKGADLIASAYAAAPGFTQNSLWHGKALVKRGQRDAAKSVLRELAEAPAASFDPEYLPESLDDQLEARKILSILQ